MCGIAGFVAPNNSRHDREEVVSRMLRKLWHRGPDDQAVVSIGNATLGVDRLAIVDRADARQPMFLKHGSRQGVIAYNGEVYNFRDVRSHHEAHGVEFNTLSDTEVVLAAHLAEGLKAIERLDGMFAYAIWHEPEEELVLVRDRLGIKPLFYVDLGHAIIFASEPKAFFCLPSIPMRPNPTAILEYFLHGAAFASGYATHDRSFFEGVKALPPAHFLTWAPHRGVKTQRYWSPVDELYTVRSNKRATQDEIADTLIKSVQEMLMGEVPIGSALSGGVDSSWITFAMAQAMQEPLISACITYSSNADDSDARHAAMLSRKLNETQPGSHVLQYTHLSLDNYLDALDPMIEAFDEPHWELRQLAMFENYRTLAHSGRTVVLTGEGADELFFGYYQKFPGFKSSSISRPADFANLWRKRIGPVRDLLRPAFSSGLVSDSLANDLIDSSVSLYFEPAWEATGDRLRSVQIWYLQTFLPWLLMDNDRCSMAHSIEGRFPFLSRKMVSLGLQLPPSWNIAEDGIMKEKVLLRCAAAAHLPQQIWRDREKSPLPVPHQSAYHAKIANRLANELDKAHDSVWEVLDRQTIVKRIAGFKERARSVDGKAGESLTAYIGLHEKSNVRTADLFAILTFLRWYDLFMVQSRRDSLCQTRDFEPGIKVMSPYQITG